MNREDDLGYYKRRAEQERSFADAATDPSVALVHLRLAEEYERRASQGSTAYHLQPANRGAATMRGH